MKLLLTTGLYPPEIGGPATYAKLLEERLPRVGIQVEVLPFSSVKKLPKVLRHAAFFWKTFVLAKSADIVFAQDTVSTGLPAMLAARLRGKPFLLRTPGDYAWEQARQRFGVKSDIDAFQHEVHGLRVACLRLAQRTVVRSAAAVITPSKYFAGIVKKWGVPEARIHVIYNTIEIPQPVEIDSIPQKPFVVSIGRLVPWKGFDQLIVLLRQLPAWRLVLIGDGPQEQSLVQLAQQEHVAGRVTFTGALSREQVFGWLKEADVFVLNTSFESFSYQTVEALAIGTPIVATNSGSLPELIESEKEGVLIPVGNTTALRNAIESTQTEREVWRVRSEKGKEKAGRFTPEPMLEAFVRLCHTICTL